MKIIYFGTPQHSAKLLEHLVKSGFDVAAVFTQPDSKKGRGCKLSESPVKITALKNKIPFHQPEKITLSSFEQALAQAVPKGESSIAVVFAFGQILPESILNLPTFGFINLHLSLLPRWRGPAPVQWTILSGDRTAGVTVQKVAFKVDTGDVLKAKSIPLTGKETAGELLEKLTEIGCVLMSEVLDSYRKNVALKGKMQDESSATYAPKLQKPDAKIVWNSSAEEIERRIRAFNPQPVAFCDFVSSARTIVVKIFKASVTSLKGLPPGKIFLQKNRILVGTADFALELIQLQPANRRVMTPQEFAAGYLIQKGEAKFE
ncbi:MAG: methionyl-tRNA formyltransferase [Planctomycetota bacterium]|nr:methionyl-tRNA formyltransferase [Planctomycetota bacterium]